MGDLLLAYDKLHIIVEDRSFYCELLVLDCGRGYANVVELSFHPLPELLVCQDSLPSNREITHLGADDLYGVKRMALFSVKPLAANLRRRSYVVG